jgi:hypothetical protein
MKSNLKKGEVRVELKYCEHCGGLWVREGGSGVYCGKCQTVVADLPISKKVRRPKLPLRRPTVLEDFAFELPEDTDVDLQSAGGGL